MLASKRPQNWTPSHHEDMAPVSSQTVLYKPQRDEPSVTVTSVSGAVGLVLMGWQKQDTICLAADKPVKLGFTENVDIHSETMSNVRAEDDPQIVKDDVSPLWSIFRFSSHSSSLYKSIDLHSSDDCWSENAWRSWWKRKTPVGCHCFSHKELCYIIVWHNYHLYPVKWQKKIQIKFSWSGTIFVQNSHIHILNLAASKILH